MVKTPHYASFWQRLAAGVIDVVIVVIAYDVMAAFTVLGIEWERELEGLPPMAVPMSDAMSFYLNIILTEIFILAYFVIFLSSKRRATLGMDVLCLTLADEESQKAVTWQRVLLRYISMTFSIAFLFIGFLMMLWTPKRQALHDRLANTVVLQRA